MAGPEGGSADQGRTGAEVRVASGEVSLHVRVAGEGPAVLLLHGFPDTGRMWRHQVGPLVEAGYRAVVPDLRGFGESDRPQEVEAYFLPELLGDLRAVLDHLDAERASVVGHDWGAALAWSLSSVAPERVERVVGVSVPPPAAFVRPSLGQLRRSWYVFLFQLRGAAEAVLRADHWRLLRMWLGPSYPDLDATLESLSRPGALTAALNVYRANFPPELLVADLALPSVRVPALGVYGVGDPFVEEEIMLRAEGLVEGSWRYERFEDGGHWLPLVAPERFNRLLLEFLAP